MFYGVLISQKVSHVFIAVESKDQMLRFLLTKKATMEQLEPSSNAHRNVYIVKQCHFWLTDGSCLHKNRMWQC